MRTLRTADLGAEELTEVRALLDASFRGFTDHDWQHALGGHHALVREDGRLVAHGSLVVRRLRVGDRSLRTGYVEAVAVRPDRRGCGLGSAVMDALEALAPAYDLLALSASEAGVPLYEARGWLAWRGPTSVLSSDGPLPTPDDDGSVYVLLRGSSLDLDLNLPLACDWRDGDVW